MQNVLYFALGVALLLAVGGSVWTWFRRSKRATDSSMRGPAAIRGGSDRDRRDRAGETTSSPSTRDTDPVAVVPMRLEAERLPESAALRRSTVLGEASSPDALRLTATSPVAGIDVITGLPNRTKFLEELELQLAALRRSGASHCIAMIRIDRFGELRAERGMRASELVLVRTAESLQRTMRDGDIVARFDRDTFVLSLANLTAREAPGAVERLRRSACQEIEIEGAPALRVTASGSFAAVDPDSEAAQLVACCRGALAMARYEESVAVS